MRGLVWLLALTASSASLAAWGDAELAQGCAPDRVATLGARVAYTVQCADSATFVVDDKVVATFKRTGALTAHQGVFYLEADGDRGAGLWAWSRGKPTLLRKAGELRFLGTTGPYVYFSERLPKGGAQLHRSDGRTTDQVWRIDEEHGAYGKSAGLVVFHRAGARLEARLFRPDGRHRVETSMTLAGARRDRKRRGEDRWRVDQLVPTRRGVVGIHRYQERVQDDVLHDVFSVWMNGDQRGLAKLDPSVRLLDPLQREDGVYFLRDGVQKLELWRVNEGAFERVIGLDRALPPVRHPWAGASERQLDAWCGRLVLRAPIGDDRLEQLFLSEGTAASTKRLPTRPARRFEVRGCHDDVGYVLGSLTAKDKLEERLYRVNVKARTVEQVWSRTSAAQPE
jgi:hypothetical protein